MVQFFFNYFSFFKKFHNTDFLLNLHLLKKSSGLQMKLVYLTNRHYIFQLGDRDLTKKIVKITVRNTMNERIKT